MYKWGRELNYIIAPTKNDIYHHGVQGQKWGIRNGPPYPLKRKTKNIEILKAIDSGEISIKLNIGRQKLHIKGKNYDGIRSYMNCSLEECEKLIRELSGTGYLIKNRGKISKERVVADKPVGVYIDPNTNKATATRKLMIVYGKKGAHIYGRQV